MEGRRQVVGERLMTRPAMEGPPVQPPAKDARAMDGPLQEGD